MFKHSVLWPLYSKECIGINGVFCCIQCIQNMVGGNEGSIIINGVKCIS